MLLIGRTVRQEKLPTANCRLPTADCQLPTDMSLHNIDKILFITLSNIGDVILTLPTLSVLRDRFPQAKIDVVVGPRGSEVIEKDPRINKLLIYNKHISIKEKINFIKKLKEEKYNLAIDMKTSLLPILIGVKTRSSIISFDRKRVRHKRLIHLNKLSKIYPSLFCFDSLNKINRERQNICIHNADREKVKSLLEKNGVREDHVLIGVSHSCRSFLKEWNIKGFIEVIRVLLKNENSRVVLIGEDYQVARANKIRNSIESKNLIDFTGKINLNELFALTERMKLLLTCDNASLHIASDLGIRVVALFGPTDPREYGPVGKKDIVVRKDLKCSPCNKAVCKYEHECMEYITAQEVLSPLCVALNTFTRRE